MLDLNEEIIILKGVCGLISDVGEAIKSGYNEYQEEELIVISNMLDRVIDKLETKSYWK